MSDGGAVPSGARQRPVLQFVVFSFNRGRFLENCIASLERCAPQCPVLIFDDHSDDPQTRAVLARVNERHPVLTPAPQPAGGSKHGGLYANMQSALDGLDESAMLCTLQDDMQLVRALGDDEIARMDGLLRSGAGRGFVHPAFLKGSERGRNAMRPDRVDQVYYADRLKSSAGAWYSDIFIARVATLRAVDWRFLPRESANEQQARQHFTQMAYWRDPFVAWLPAAPAWRGKRRTWALRQGERRHRCGFHPLCIMDKDAERRFRARDLAILPYAEDFLTLRDGSLPEPWIYHPLQGSRWLKWLNSLELKLRRRGGQ